MWVTVVIPTRNFWVHFFSVWSRFFEDLMRRSNCSDPITPGTPEDITFWGVAPVSLSLYFCLAPPKEVLIELPCPALYNHSNLYFSSAPPFFITHIFLWPQGCPGRGMGAEQFDRRIIDTLHRDSGARSVGHVQLAVYEMSVKDFPALKHVLHFVFLKESMICTFLRII